jgi:hypothetical protein
VPHRPVFRRRRCRRIACRIGSAVAVSGAIAIAIAVAVAAAAGRPAAAQRATRALPPVEVTTLRDPVVKSYRRIVRGLDEFERRHALAPDATLRFRLLPRQDATDMEAIALRIVGVTVALPVPVAPDHTFTIPRDARALAQDAVVVPNRRSGSMTWRADIRTPGLPPGTRRLGDLRLECRVGMEAGLISDYPPSFFGELARRLGGRGYCDQREPRYFFFAERPLWSVTLVRGDRREVRPVDRLYAGASERPMTAEDFRHCDCAVWLDRTYFAPLGDERWPDDTRIEFQYMDEATGADPLHGRTAAELIAAFGPASVVRFASGYEVWVYRDERSPSFERVVLVSPAGIAARSRVRAASP